MLLLTFESLVDLELDHEVIDWDHQPTVVAALA